MAIENSIVPKSFRPAAARLGRGLVMCAALSGVVIVGAELMAQNTAPAQSEQRSDNAIAQDINRKIMASKTVVPLNLGVWVHDGTVTLTGNAPTQDLREDAVNLVKSVPGVQNVDDKVTVGNEPATAPITSNQPDTGVPSGDEQNPPDMHGSSEADQHADNAIAQDINRKIMASKAVLPLNLGVWVHNGTVTLTGNVPTQQLREDAENLVKSVAGVQNVDDKITVGNVPATSPIASSRQNPSQQNPDEQNPDEQNGGEQSARDSGYAQNAPPPVYDTQRPQSDMLDVARGTPVYVMIMRRIDSRHSKPGQQFHGIVVQDVVEQNGMIAVPRGADITGTVVDARGPGHLKGRPEIALQLDSLNVANASYPFISYMWARGGPGKGGQSAANIGGSAAAGAIIGGAVGGGGTALLGGLLGGLGGAGLSALSSGPRLIVPSESILTFYLNAPVTVREPTRGEIDMLASRVPPAANGYGRRGYYGRGYQPPQPGYGQPGYPPPPPQGPPGGYPY